MKSSSGETSNGQIRDVEGRPGAVGEVALDEGSERASSRGSGARDRVRPDRDALALPVVAAGLEPRDSIHGEAVEVLVIDLEVEHGKASDVE